MSAGVVLSDTDITPPGHINSINYNLLPLNILFDTVKDTLPSCSVNKLLGLINSFDMYHHILDSFPGLIFTDRVSFWFWIDGINFLTVYGFYSRQRGADAIFISVILF